ncbi:MAG: fatty acid hydroxylase [Gammaproteobacteria bacterium]|nr:MAG: fatty acid hydroxylase [Gammaproteobacteria bacterium]
MSEPFAVALRFSTAVAVFLALAAWEARRPRRRDGPPRRRRWPANLGLAAVDIGLLRLLPWLAPLAAAEWAAAHGWGVLPWLGVGGPAAALLTLVALDGALWLQHRALHAWAPLWRLHQVHHADPALDVSSGLRFHPLEILLSAAYKSGWVLVLGAGPAVVLLFEALLNLASLFTHANVVLPPRCDRRLRRLLVTPDMHRIHHSQRPDETDSNFGFFLSVWDRLFGTYRARARRLQSRIAIGLARWPDQRQNSALLALLAMPWRAPGRDRGRLL